MCKEVVWAERPDPGETTGSLPRRPTLPRSLRVGTARFERAFPGPQTRCSSAEPCPVVSGVLPVRRSSFGRRPPSCRPYASGRRGPAGRGRDLNPHLRSVGIVRIERTPSRPPAGRASPAPYPVAPGLICLGKLPRTHLEKPLVGTAGFEPATPASRTRCSRRTEPCPVERRFGPVRALGIRAGSAGCR